MSDQRYPELPIGPRLLSVLEVAWRARRPVLLEGHTGIGKSEIIQTLARNLGIQSVVLDLSLLEPPDLVGLPFQQEGRTVYAPPAILPQAGEGILMLEELNRAERYIQQPALQLLSARRLHTWQLPPGWSCCAAINPERGDYQVAPLDPALRARFLYLRVRADRASWRKWAEGTGVHPAVLALAGDHDRFLEEIPPRTWVYVSELLHALRPQEQDDPVLMRDLLGGYLPIPWVESLILEVQRWGGPSSVDVGRLLKSYHEAADLQKTVKELAQQGKTDQLLRLVDQVRVVIEAPQLGVRIDEKAFDLRAFERLIVDLPGDHRERLQESLGRNPVAARLIPLRPEDVLKGFPGSQAQKTLGTWIKDRTLWHRVYLLTTAVGHFIDTHRDLNAFRRDSAAMISLGHLLQTLGDLSKPLVKVLERRAVSPVLPRK